MGTWESREISGYAMKGTLGPSQEILRRKPTTPEQIRQATDYLERRNAFDLLEVLGLARRHDG